MLTTIYMHILVLNASLKSEKSRSISNTDGLAKSVISNMRGRFSSEIIRLADLNIPAVSDIDKNEDSWPTLLEKIRLADIVIFATPIIWGERSSHLQRIIERLDTLHETYLTQGTNILYDKVAGIVVTGSEDGALHTIGSLMSTLSFMGFVLPPECFTYWVGETGQAQKDTHKKILKNKETDRMSKAMAKNLIRYAVSRNN